MEPVLHAAIYSIEVVSGQGIYGLVVSKNIIKF